MGLRIMTNVPSLAAQTSLGRTNRKLDNVLGKLSSGSRIVKAADDSAGLAVSEKMRANLRSISQANRNANDGISLIQTAEGGLNEVSNVLIRLRELAIQSSTDTLGETERSFTNQEFQALKTEIQRTASSTEFNGRKLLSGDGDALEFHIGTGNKEGLDRIQYDSSQINSNPDSLGISSLGVGEKEDARESLEALDEAFNKISSQRAFLGAYQNRMQSAINSMEILHENLSAANSRIRDTDYAKAQSENTKLSIVKAAGTSVLAQSNTTGTHALKLLG